MSEYISTFRACNMLGVNPAQSFRLTKVFNIRSKKDFTYKLWNLDDINAELQRRKEERVPPKGWIRLEEAAEILGWSAPVSKSIMLAQGLMPELKKLWTKGKRYKQVACWNKRAVQAVAAELRKGNRKHPPEGWLTFADCMDFLGASKERTHYWLRKYKVGFKRVTNRRFFYAEDDVVALRRFMKTNNMNKQTNAP